MQYPKFCLDSLPPDVLKRLDVHAIRYGEGYKPTTDKDYAQWYADEGKKLSEYNAADIAVLFMVGGGAFTDPTQPMRHPRPWLDDKGVMQDGKFDLAWLPSYDADFQQWSYRFARDYGWPRGPINGVLAVERTLGGHLDLRLGRGHAALPRHLSASVAGRRARRARVTARRVLVGRLRLQSSNAMDKLFPGRPRTRSLPMFDFL